MKAKIKIITVFLLVLMAAIELPGVQASSITRSFSGISVKAGESITVTLDVKITAGETFYLIDDSVPSGWKVVSSETGDFTDPGHVKWAVIQNAANTTYTYIAQAPAGAGAYSFSGKYMFEGMKSEGTVEGQTSVAVSSASQNSAQGQTMPNMPLSTPMVAGIFLIGLFVVLMIAAHHMSAKRKKEVKAVPAAST